jgi:hypothetical protein
MRKRVFFLALCLALLLACGRISLAALSLDLRLDRPECAVDETVRLVVQLHGAQQAVVTPRIKGLEPFRVEQGGTSSRIEIVNGQVRAAVEYTYFLTPLKPGNYAIGPAEMAIDGNTLTSRSVELKVQDAPKADRSSQGPLFLQGTLSSAEAYLDEQVVYILKLYRQVRVADLSLELPEMEKMTWKQLGQPQEYQSTHQESAYQVLEIRYALAGSKEGQYEIPPLKLHLNAFIPQRRAPRGPFDDSFFKFPFFSFEGSQAKTLKTDPLKLTIKALPQAGRPADFSGLVGTFRMETKIEPKSLAAGESCTLSVAVSGRGNVHRIPDLKAPTLEAFKVYADQPALTVETGPEGLTGSKTMKWALVPERQGAHQIPPLTLSYFDPSSQRYRVLRSEPLTLTVLPGKEAKTAPIEPSSTEGAQTGGAKKAVQDLGRDILPIQAAVKDLGSEPMPDPRQAVFWVLLLAPPLFFSVVLLGLRISHRSPSALAAGRARKAARRIIGKCGGPLSADALSSALRDYVNERFGLSLGTLTAREVETALAARGVGRETVERVIRLLKALEDIVYTGRAEAPCPLTEDVPGLIRRIEKEAS